MKTIPLLPTDLGHVALVDDIDYNLLIQYRWYAVRTSSGGKKAQASINNKTVLMHRLIMNAPKGMQVDHINMDTLDNQRSNLRICTNAQNTCNQKGKSSRLSQYKGVSWHKKNKKWIAAITKNGQSFYLGSFESEIAAARTYDREARFLHGEFARLNFSSEENDD